MLQRLCFARFNSILSRHLYFAAVLAILLAGGTCRASAQYASVPVPEWGASPTVAPSGPAVSPQSAAMLQKRIHALNQQRQKSLVADTQKLVKLATELNAEINSSHQTELTPDQARTVADSLRSSATSIRSTITRTL